MELKLTKKYSTKTIRAVLIMFMEMLDSIPIDYDFFYEYTGLSTTIYTNVRKIIEQMIIDLKLNVTYEVIKTEQIGKTNVWRLPRRKSSKRMY